MRRNLFYIVIGMVAIGIILLNTNNTVKYLTCEDPNNYIYIIEEKTSEELIITFDTTTSAETYSDYVYHIEDGTLYIGVKYSLNFLSDEGTSRYTATIDLTEEVNNIILKGNNIEKVIYPD